MKGNNPGRFHAAGVLDQCQLSSFGLVSYQNDSPISSLGKYEDRIWDGKSASNRGGKAQNSAVGDLH